MLNSSKSKYKGKEMWKNYSKNNSTWIISVVFVLTPTSLYQKQTSLSHCIFAAKYISSFRVFSIVLQAVISIYLELTCEVEPVWLLCSGRPLCLEHRMCVGVMEDETE